MTNGEAISSVAYMISRFIGDIIRDGLVIGSFMTIVVSMSNIVDI